MPKLTGLWRHPDFLKLWAGQTLSALSSNVTDLALPLIAALVLHASAFEEADVMADGLGDVWTTLPPPLQGAVEEAWSAYCAGSLARWHRRCCALRCRRRWPRT